MSKQTMDMDFWHFPIFSIHYVLLVMLPAVRAQTYSNVYDLQNNLLIGYSTNVRPLDNQSTTVAVNFSLSLFQLNDIDVVHGRISMSAMAHLSWHDERISWNPSAYGNISYTDFPRHLVWRPHLICASSVSYIVVMGEKWMSVRYFADGHAFYTPADIVESSCTFDVSYWPFDSQTCDVSFTTYGYSVLEVNLTLVYDKVNMNRFVPHGEWQLTGSSSRYYSANNGIYDMHIVVYSLFLKRRSEFYVINIILPIVGTMILNPMVFLLPSESGERTGYSITVILSVAVFITIVSDNIPTSSAPMAKITNFIIICLACSILISLAVILNLKVYHASGDVPAWVTALVCFTKCQRKPTSKVQDLAGKTRPTSADTTRVEVSRNPSNCNTGWKDVSKAIDKILFTIFCLGIWSVTLAFMVVLSSGDQ